MGAISRLQHMPMGFHLHGSLYGGYELYAGHSITASLELHRFRKKCPTNRALQIEDKLPRNTAVAGEVQSVFQSQVAIFAD